jgi:tetratricopeptide (TPR) repeat protein
MVTGVVFVSCEKDTNITNIIDNDFETAEQRLTAEGWTAFKASNFEQAKDSFLLATHINSLYPDAYNGLGWTYANLDLPDEAHTNFTICMVSQQNEQIYKDACAGRSFVNLAMSNYEMAITDARNAAMVLIDPDYNYYTLGSYVFRHVTEINQDDLMLVIAESYFMLGSYNNCFQTLLYLDDTLESTTDPEELAMLIETFKQTI